MEELVITGIRINYFYICHTKLWYFSHHMQMEHSSDLVAIGKFLHEDTYKREKKELKIGGIAIDFVRRGDVIELHEVKKSNRMEKADEMQTLYYLYVLRSKGVNATASIDYPVIRKRRVLELDENGAKEVEGAIEGVQAIVSMNLPPEPKRVSYCPKCAYYELCWSD